jgi:hypothetical protein
MCQVIKSLRDFMQRGFAADEAPRSKLRGIKAELHRNQPAFALQATARFTSPFIPVASYRIFWRRRTKRDTAIQFGDYQVRKWELFLGEP